MGGQLAIGEEAASLGTHANPRDFQDLYRSGLFAADPALEVDEGAIAGELLEEPGALDAEDGRELARDLGGVLDAARLGVDRVDVHRDGQLGPVAVLDHPALGGDPLGPHGLAARGVVVVISGDDLELVGASDERASPEEQAEADEQDPPRHRAPGVLLLLGLGADLAAEVFPAAAEGAEQARLGAPPLLLGAQVLIPRWREPPPPAPPRRSWPPAPRAARSVVLGRRQVVAIGGQRHQPRRVLEGRDLDPQRLVLLEELAVRLAGLGHVVAEPHRLNVGPHVKQRSRHRGRDQRYRDDQRS